jgi:hypothetical protein
VPATSRTTPVRDNHVFVMMQADAKALSRPGFAFPAFVAVDRAFAHRLVGGGEAPHDVPGPTGNRGDVLPGVLRIDTD